MGRLGIPHADVPAFLMELKKLSSITMEGLVSHFASADELDESGQYYTRLQAERFAWALAETRKAGFAPAMSISPTVLRHCSEISRTATWCGRALPCMELSLRPISRASWICVRSCA